MMNHSFLSILNLVGLGRLYFLGLILAAKQCNKYKWLRVVFIKLGILCINGIHWTSDKKAEVGTCSNGLLVHEHEYVRLWLAILAPETASFSTAGHSED